MIFVSSVINKVQSTGIKKYNIVHRTSQYLLFCINNILFTVIQNVTLEPVMLFMSFVGGMDRVSVGQMIIEKSCTNDFAYNVTVCNDLLNDAYSHENAAVQSEIAQFKVF